MLPEERLAKIAKMEAILNESNEFLGEVEFLLARWQELLPKMKSLEEYYFSEDWREDFEAYENGEIPEDKPCGVLSEDAVYDAIGTQRSLAIESLKLATQILDEDNY